jgi:hypothetical protein
MNIGRFARNKTIKKTAKNCFVVFLLLLLLSSNIPLGIVDFLAEKLSERNIVDLLWLAEHDGSVIDSLKPDNAQAAEVTIESDTTDTTYEFGASPTVVFTTNQIGYIFFVDSASDLAYRKTTNGGTNWSAAQVIDNTLDGWLNVSVWYDQWTPGDSTGTLIHVAASATSSDDIYYTYLNTSGDTLRGSVTAALSGTTFTEGSNAAPSIAKNADGSLFIAANFANYSGSAGGAVAKSTDGGDNWSDITPSGWSSVSIDQIQLLPLLTDNDIVAIKAETSSNAIKYQIYHEASTSWAGSWSIISTTTENTTYDQWFSATIKKSTGDVYLTLANYAANANNDIEFWSLDDDNRVSGFSQKSNVYDNSNAVVSPVPLVEEDTGNVYVAYIKGSTNYVYSGYGLGSVTYIYYKKSTDGGTTWSSENGVLNNDVGDDYRFLRGNLLSSDRLFVAYYDDDDNDIFGTTIASQGVAVEANIDTAIIDATDEYGPAPSTVFLDDQTGYQFFIKTNVMLDATDEFSPSPAVVFTNATTGYVFFIDSPSQDLVYRKTINGGLVWSGSFIIDTAIAGWTSLAVWYDQWTPGDTTGTKIHIAFSDDNTDDYYYTYLDTNDDSFGVSINAILLGTAITELSVGVPGITKSASGNLFLSGNFNTTAGGKVAKSTDGGTSWSDVTPSGWSSVAADQIQVLPLLTDNDIIAIKEETGSNAIKYQTYYEASTSWAGSWRTIATSTEHTTYDQWFSATIKKSTGDVYLAHANYTANANNDIEFWSFDDGNRSAGFSQGANLFTDDATVMMPVPLVDENSGDVYVAYLRGTLASATRVYSKKSTDGGSSWGSESASLSPGIVDTYYSLRGNLLSTERLYVVSYNNDLNDIMGNTIADLWTADQYAYKWFENSEDSTDVGAELAEQDSVATLESAGQEFRLRLLLHLDKKAGAGVMSLKLQFSEKSGTCDTVFSGESYVDVTTTTVIAYDNQSPSDGVALTPNGDDPTGGYTIVNQSYEELNNFKNSQGMIPDGQDGKWDFSLIDNGATAGTGYCFRIVNADDSTTGLTYTVIPEITTEQALSVVDISLNDGYHISLIEDSTTSVYSTGMVSNSTGYTDIVSVIGRIFRSGASGGEDCSLDNNDCYEDLGCATTSCFDANSCVVRCDFNVWSYADPTDIISPWPSENWIAWIKAIGQSASTTATNTSESIDVYTLRALEVVSSIPYGIIDAGSGTGSFNPTTTITNTGNSAIDLEICGTDLCTDYPTCVLNEMDVSSQEYSTSAFVLGSGISLLNSTSTLDVDLPKPLSFPSNSTDIIYWGLGVPENTAVGTYAGENTFTAIPAQ